MSGILDTSVVVRYLTGDTPRLATVAAAIVDSGEILKVPLIVIAESGFVLAAVYKLERPTTVDALIEFLQKANISTIGVEKGLAVRALSMCRPSHRVSFADALIWAEAVSAGEQVIYSLDERFPSLGIRVLNKLVP